MPTLREADLTFLKGRGIHEEEAKRQLGLLQTPPPPAALDRPAILEDGILPLDARTTSHWMEAGARAVQSGRLLRFVPASGAASRMFRDLLNCMHVDVVADAHGDETPELRRYREQLEDFAFWPELDAALNASGFQAGELSTPEGARASLRVLLERDQQGNGLALASQPKGLIPFHRSADEVRTPVEEHLHEAAALLGVTGGEELTVKAHFTVSSEHANDFRELIAELLPRLEALHDVRFEVTFSSQDSSTDTLAVTTDGELVRDESGLPLLRPGGHGALILNLEAADGDLITIKNIDNVLPRGRQQLVVETKLALVGLAAETQATLHRHLRELHEAPSEESASAAETFAADTLGIQLPEGADLNARVEALKEVLDRPVRVCGVVPNVGEPGGGPYWVRGREGYPRLQIVESSQIDTDDPNQAQMMKSATHFNPVDLVCAMRDWQGNPHRLSDLVEPATSFVAEKSVQGEALLALERPGLWNGAMDGWHTIFVEVPNETFAPVKTVFDLLRPEHQGSAD